MKFISSAVLFAVLLINLQNVSSDRILGLFTSPIKSHIIIHLATMKGLIEKGHNVTIVTTIPIDKSDLKFRHIQLNASKIPDEIFKTNSNPPKGIKKFEHFTKFVYALLDVHKSSLHEEQMKKIMDTESFDLVVIGYFFNGFQLGVAAHFKCPVVISWMVQPIKDVSDMVGQPTEPLYVPHLMAASKQPLGFLDRVKNIMFYVIDILKSFIMHRKMAAYYEEAFPSDKYPTYDEMRKNISLILVNHHFSQSPIAPIVPAIIEIGGIQVKDKPNTLPKDIKTFLDSAKSGAILFSLGSNIRSSNISPEKIEIIYKVLSNLKQKVIWKWETDQKPGNSPNILFKNWIPQDDLLQHPNVKLFISHCGGGSTIESQIHGVPILGLPVFGDQFTNSKAVQDSDFGIQLPLDTINEENFLVAIDEILNNPKYKENIERFSKVYRDRPMSAKDTATYWMEYVIRHNGAKHMQSPAVHLNFVQYYGLDVLGFILFIVFLTIKIFAYLFRKFACLVRKILRMKSESLKQKSKKE